MMDEGISDDKSFTGECKLSTDSITGDDGKQYKLKVKSVKATSRKIKETEIENSGTISEFSGNIVANVAIVPGGGDETPWNYDTPGLNAKLYVHVIYESGILNYNPYYKITQLSGKLEQLDITVFLMKIEINENCFGTRYTAIDESARVGQGQYNMTTVADHPVSGTYYYNNSLSPYFWNIADGLACHVNGTVTGCFLRGGTQWSASVKWTRP